jgi:GT2 family glycosyltransferase
VKATGRLDDGLSFCVISNGERPENLERLLASIHTQGIRSYEVIVAGLAGPDNLCRYIPEEQAAAEGKVSFLRNRAAAAARFTRLVFCDDDTLFGKNWYRCLVPDLGRADLITTRIINPDGTRFWDWASFGGPGGHQLLEYDDTSPYLYLTGGMLVVKTDVWRRTLWNEHLRHGDAEDVDFSFRAVNNGSRLHLCRNAYVIHDDWKYTQVGRQVIVRSEDAVSMQTRPTASVRV